MATGRAGGDAGSGTYFAYFAFFAPYVRFKLGVVSPVDQRHLRLGVDLLRLGRKGYFPAEVCGFHCFGEV
jgi:hypothetical protein